MAFAIIANDAAGGTANTVTSASLDTTGANLLVIVAIWYAPAGVITVSDSKSNTWTPRTEYTSGGSNARVQIYYNVAGTVGTGHTFTVAGTSKFPSIWVLAASGSHGTPYASENGANTSSATSLQPGSVTPPEDGCLVVTGLDCYTGTSANIGSGYTAMVEDYLASNHLGGGGAYLIQGTAAAINPTWSWTTTGEAVACQAVFKSDGITGGATAHNLLLLGCGA